MPPARFTEATLIRALEADGIGRPSTYAEIISKVQARDYAEKLPGGAFKPTTLGTFVVDGLVRSALDFMDPNFTAKMEEDLDEVESGKLILEDKDSIAIADLKAGFEGWFPTFMAGEEIPVTN